MMRKQFAFLCVLMTGLVGAARQANAPPQRPAFKAKTVSIEVDVTVFDKRHQFVRDITQGEVQLFDDDEPGEIATFLIVDLPRSTWPKSPGESVSPAEHTAAVQTGFGGRVYVVILDDLHIEASRSRLASRTVRQFIDKYLAANDRMAIVYSSQIDAGRQPFTNNRDVLRSAVERFAGRGRPPSTLDGNRDFNARIHDAALAMNTVERIADALANVQSQRKAILLVSEGVDVDYTRLKEQPNALEGIEATDAAAEAATKANVTVYAIDPRGTTQLGDDSIQIGSLHHSYRGAAAIDAGLREDLRRGQDNLRSLADQTGGFAVVNQNDLTRAFGRIVDENTSYYIIGYQVSPNHQDGRPHKVTVRVSRPGVEVHGSRTYRLAPAK